MAVTTSPFVGRERELAVLRDALGDAAGGVGSIGVISGEPGIGKTRIAADVAALARSEGGVVLWGACYEGEARPYGPWIDALLACTRGYSAGELARLLGPSAPVLVELAPELSQSLGDLPAVADLTAADARLRAYAAWVQTLRAFPETPAVVVLDDLQWADATSLELLRYVGRTIRGSAVLVLCTYRDVEVELTHPLAACLHELDRHGVCTRVALDRLQTSDAGRLVELLLAAPPASGQVEAIVDETEGNPFFIAEVVRHVHEGGTGVPESVRQAVGSRIARLSADAARTLSVAAAFTRPFDFGVLQTLTELDDDRLLACLDEALKAALLRPAGAGGDAYEFTHSIVRHALYEELSPSRKTRLHRRIAQALEHVHAGREDDAAAELAYQYALSASLPGSEHGVRFALTAAELARAAYASAEAATFLRIARRLSADGSAAIRADILCRLALAEADAYELEGAAHTADEALAALAAAGAAPAESAEFLGRLASALKDAGAADDLLAPIVRRGLEAAGTAHDLSWARLALVRLPIERRRSGALEYAVWRGFDSEALAVARRSRDEVEYARTLEPLDTRARQETEELLELVRGWTTPSAKIHGLTVAARVLLYRFGAFAESDEVARELRAASELYGSVSGQAYALVLLAEIAADRGDFAEAQRRAEAAQRLISQLGPGHRLRRWRAGTGLLTGYVGGDWAGLARTYQELAAGPGAGWPWMSLVAAGAALAYARAGEPEPAKRLLADLTPAIEDQEAVFPGLSEAVGEAAAVVWELELPEYAARYHALATGLVRAGVVGTLGSSSALTTARMSAVLGRHEEAESWFARARSELEESGQRPLRAVVDHDEALARHRAGRGDAANLLAAARREFDALGMTFWLERAEVLAAFVQHTRPRGLTAREAEVLRLVAAGRSNKEIAAELVLSVHTIERHLANAYAKIDARNRADATAFALRTGL